jgi:energy-coupling factor transporter ATP-binding protein EcfA2
VGASVLEDLDIDALVSAMQTSTVAGATALRQRLSNPINDEAELQNRRSLTKSIRARCKGKEADIAALREQLHATEAEVNTVANASSDKRHAEYYNQILWAAESRFAPLNQIGWLNEAIVFFRTLFLPAISILLPLVVFIAPIVFYNIMMQKPLTLEGYLSMIQTSLKKAMPSVLGKPRFAGTGGILEYGEQFVHLGVSAAMFIASIWNQVSAATTMRAVVADIRSRADAVLAFSQATRALGEALGSPIPAEATAWSPGQLGLFGEAWNSSEKVRALLTKAGELDMLAAVALTKRTCFPKQVSSVRLTDLYHPGLQATDRIYNSIEMGTSDKLNHVLLTGPNRGGKSTLLKSLGSAVLMAQTVGVVFARKAILPVFGNIITALSPQDVVGKLSLFEAEIEFAKDVRARLAEPNAEPTFLMMDEIFHGTNAHDGVEASQVFLDDLYKTSSSRVFSVVSTHYMDLPKRYGAKQGSARTQNLCMEASVDPADPDRLVYTYRVCEGVNQFSSVKEILQERGLLIRSCGTK